MLLIPLKINKIITKEDNIIDLIIYSLGKNNLKPKDGDILAISAKIISITMGYYIKLEEIIPSNKALELSEKHAIDPRIVEIIVRNKVEILGGLKGVLATINKGFLIGNGGLDLKNMMEGYISMWPDDPDSEAEKIRNTLYSHFGAKIGVIIVDSRVLPLRLGTVGFALGSAGIETHKNYIGKKDLYNKKIRFTSQNIIDELASAAHLYMGEAQEMIPMVYIKDPPIEVCEKCKSSDLNINTDECLYMSNLKS